MSIIKRRPELEYIILSGFDAENSTARSFIRYMKENSIDIPEIKKINKETVFDISVEKRKITCAVVNSTSPLARKSLTDLVAQFKKWIKK